MYRRMCYLIPCTSKVDKRECLHKVQHVCEDFEEGSGQDASKQIGRENYSNFV